MDTGMRGCGDAGMQGCGDAGMQDERLVGIQKKNKKKTKNKPAGMQRCMDTGMRACGDAGGGGMRGELGKKPKDPPGENGPTKTNQVCKTNRNS